MIKRLTMALVLALIAGSLSFAEVRIKDLDGTNVEITFLFKDDTASEMGVIGSFNNWTQPGEMMTKNADGLWEKTIKASVADSITYKFLTKGTWIYDEMAPDKKDDGYGGNNGLIPVADILSGLVPITPVAAAPASADAGPVVKTYPSKMTFGTGTIFGTKTTFSTQGLVDKTKKGLETDSTGFYGKSTWNLGGTIVPGVNIFMDGKVFEGYQDIWAQDSTGKVSPTLNEGLSKLAGTLLVNPVNALGGQNPVMNSLKMGIESPYLNWETGYGDAKPQDHNPILWSTLKARSGGNGYMRFDLGKSARKFGPATVEAAIIPNHMFDELSFMTWTTVSIDATKVDFQYDAKSAEKDKLGNFFNKLYHQDFLLGVRTKVSAVELQVQGLVNQYSEADFDLTKNLAGEAKVTWALPAGAFGVATAYRYTGSMAELLYGDNNDGTGTKGTQRVTLNVWGKPLGLSSAGIDTTTTLTTESLDDNAYEFYTKTYAEVSLDKIVGKTSSINAYLKAKYNFLKDYEYDATQAAYQLGEVGAKWYLSNPVESLFTGMDLYYGFNNWDKEKVFNSVVASMKMPGNASLDLATGVRLVRDDVAGAAAMKKTNNLMGYGLGGSWKLPLPALKSPLLYGAFVYNMDPFGEGGLSMSDFTTEGGPDKNDGKAQLRMMLKWEF